MYATTVSFSDKQMILAVLTGNTTTSKSWKSVCNIYLFLWRTKCQKISVHPTVSFAAISQGSCAPEGIALHQKKANVMICPSARGLFAPSVAVHSLKLWQMLWRAISHPIVKQVTIGEILGSQEQPDKSNKNSEIQKADMNLLLSCGPASACSKLYGEQQDKRRNGKKCSLESFPKSVQVESLFQCKWS